MKLHVDSMETAVYAALKKAKHENMYAIVRAQHVEGMGVSILGGTTQSKSVSDKRGIGIHLFDQEGYNAFGSISNPNIGNG